MHPDPVGHGLLSRFHDGCRCPWCVSVVREGKCRCPTCTQLRAASPYVEPRRDRDHPIGGPKAESGHRLLSTEPNIPEESATYQLMCQLPRYDAATLLDLHARCRHADPAWRRAAGEFADYVIDLISLWPR